MIRELITKLEAAQEGSRELDAQIAETQGWRMGLGIWVPPGVKYDHPQDYPEHPPSYTTSLDAALALVPADTHWMLKTCEHDGVSVYVAEVVSKPYPMSAGAPTAPLAVCVAALKARVKG